MYEKILLRLDKGNDISYNFISNRIKILSSGYNDYIYKKSNALRYLLEDFNE